MEDDAKKYDCECENFSKYWWWWWWCQNGILALAKQNREWDMKMIGSRKKNRDWTSISAQYKAFDNIDDYQIHWGVVRS